MFIKVGGLSHAALNYWSCECRNVAKYNSQTGAKPDAYWNIAPEDFQDLKRRKKLPAHFPKDLFEVMDEFLHDAPKTSGGGAMDDGEAAADAEEELERRERRGGGRANGSNSSEYEVGDQAGSVNPPEAYPGEFADGDYGSGKKKKVREDPTINNLRNIAADQVR
jgi:hypothetical protein